MHVDVDLVVGHFQKKQRRGKSRRRQNVAVGFVNRVQNQPVAHQAPVYKNVDSVAIRPLYVRTRRKSTHRQRGFFFFRLECRLRDGRAEWRGNGGALHYLLPTVAYVIHILAVGPTFLRGVKYLYSLS